jgi:predicted SAM-dependent methyltransferase
METRPMTKNITSLGTSPDLKNELIQELQDKGNTILNLGCGEDYIEGWVNIDGNPTVDCDLILNLDDKNVMLPFDTDSVDSIMCLHILEHIHELQALKREMLRVLRPDGALMVIVPDYRSLDAWGDDTHCRAFSVHSFMGQYWPGMRPSTVEEIQCTDCLGFNTTWLLARLTKGENK